MLHPLYNDSIGKYIQFLHPFLLYVDVARVAENVHQTRFVNLPRYDFGSDD